MDLSRPYGVISHPLDTAVLAVLVGTTRPLTGREVARLAPEGSQQGIAKALTRLAEQGLVERRDAGNAILYSLNREHLAAPAVESLVRLRQELFERLEREIAAWEVEPVHLSLFGSAARGDGDSTSDLDLLVVRPRSTHQDDPRWRAQLDSLAESVLAWTGNHLGLSEVGKDDIERLRRERPPVVEEVVTDAVTLHGPEPRKLFGKVR